MKKILNSLFIIFALFMLFGCETPDGGEGGGDNPPIVDGETLTEEDYQKEIIDLLGEKIPSEATEDLELIREYYYEDGSFADITWETSDQNIINKKGFVKKAVFDTTVTMSADIIVYAANDDEYTFEFSKDVAVKGSITIEEYKKIIESYLPDYTYQDIELRERDTTFIYDNILGTITYTSKSPDVLTSDGKYVNQNKEDQAVEFCYSVAIQNFVVEGSKIIIVEGKKDDYYTEQASLWLDNYFKDIDVVVDELELPVTDDKGRVTITWRSGDLDVLSHSGKLLTYSPDLKGKMVATISCNDYTSTWEKEFSTYSEEDYLDFLVQRMHRDEIKQYMLSTYLYTTENAGFIPFYIQDLALESLVATTTANNETINYLTGKHNTNVAKLDVITGLKPWDSEGRPQTLKKSTDFITIHDTGDGTHDATWWNNYVSTYADDRQASWHFTVGDTVVYQHIPLDEVAWHAGDGSVTFSLKDTGIVYDGPDPIIELNDDGYLYINGQKSNIPIPIVNYPDKPKYHGKPANAITPAGLYTTKGANGNYYMADVYASNYSKNLDIFYVCTKGGNRNSVGFETCINKGVDYNQVMRNTANIVAKLLVHYNLTPDRVLYHQSFAGKLCPQVMIENNLLPYFEKMIENEYIIAKYYPGISFKYESNNPDLLSNDGKILKFITEDTTVSYKVTVSFNGETRVYEMTTLIKEK